MPSRILIVEDSSTQQMVIKKSIKVAGFEVETFLSAMNGIEGLEKLSQEKVDIILCDINMPKMNGIEFISKVKDDERYKNIPIVVITTEATKDKYSYILSKGVIGFVKKPFTTEQIYEALEKVLN